MSSLRCARCAEEGGQDLLIAWGEIERSVTAIADWSGGCLQIGISSLSDNERLCQVFHGRLASIIDNSTVARMDLQLYNIYYVFSCTLLELFSSSSGCRGK